MFLPHECGVNICRSPARISPRIPSLSGYPCPKMWRSLVLILGWTVAAITLYAGLVALELYWNLFDWLPRMDSKAICLVIVLPAALSCFWWLAAHSVDRGSRMFSLVACLALVALGVYVFPPEQKSQGLFS